MCARYDPVVHIDSDRRLSNDLAAKHVSEVLETYCDNSNNSGTLSVSILTIQALKRLLRSRQVSFSSI
jgi:hypothetical protein